METTKELQIDETLYSRQLYVIGKNAMSLLSESKILIINFNGLCLEIIKNIMLMGIKSITISDNKKIEMSDLTTNYYLNEDDIGKDRVLACINKLRELNPFITIEYKPDLYITKEIIINYDVVILNNYSLNESIKINKLCRNNNVKFILCGLFGLFGNIFCDFGDKFIINDVDGEEIKRSMITEIIPHHDGIRITVPEKHLLESGDKIKISNINGNLNNIYKIKKIISPKEMIVEGTIQDIQICNNIEYEQIKEIKEMNFKSLEESLKMPEFMYTDALTTWKVHNLHSIYEAINGETNELNNEELFNKIKNKYTNINEEYVKKVLPIMQGEIMPLCSIIGGIVSNEIIKACTKKLIPIMQWFYFESLDISIDNTINKQCTNILNNRYINQTKMLGNELQKKLEESTIFIVGAGAIGCEHLKNLAMLGIGTLIVTDMDSIEKSNLSRQFLFRNNDIGKSKSVVAGREINKMNPNVNIIIHQNKINEETSNIYNDAFFNKITCVANALDNIPSRIYMDEECIKYSKALFEAGTLGLKGNVQTIIPHLTESYSHSSYNDPPEESIPLCTLKRFPYTIEHVIQWSRDIFDELFTNPFIHTKKYMEDSTYLSTIDTSQLKNIKNDIDEVLQNIPECFDECINYGISLWNKLFKDEILELIKMHPKDSKDNNNILFWSGTKRFPRILDVNDTNLYPLYESFVLNVAILRAKNYGLEITTKNIIQIIYKNIEKKQQNIKKETIKIFPIIYEKDDKSQLDFITACVNNRAYNYNISIPTLDSGIIKKIAGKIVPAIITTTAIVSGLVSLEILKYINGKRNIEDYRNYYINLGMPLITYYEPGKCKITKMGNNNYSFWDIFKFKNPSIKEILDFFQTKYEIEISSIMHESIIIFSQINKYDKNTKILSIYEKITGKQAKLPLLITCYNENDENDEDIPECLIYG